MALNWFVIAMGGLALLAIPGTILLFNYDARIARLLIWLMLGVIMVLNGVYWITGDVISF
jgi:hypothetical protein